ncbi:GDP-mannose 4,6-dehydratase [Candidatus Woesearchaeota archaeon]|nr:GDP-mannose 4,6-dehydratase [Candidatus Woesearchaeota archaeon]
MAKKALITGLTGQDGSYLAELLLEKGYDVHGMYRRTSMDVFERTKKFKDRIHLHGGDITDLASLMSIMKEVKPDEVYNLAAQSFVPDSWTQAIATGEITALGVTRMLEAIRSIKSDTKFYQASSSEMFGKITESPQTEKTPFHPRSPYGVAKVYGYFITINYRESYDIFACNGILFNHESPRRGKQFVTRKITHSVAKIKATMDNCLKSESNRQECFELGNLNAERDWGFAGDYVRAMWLILQHNKPDDYVISSEETHSVRYFVEAAFNAVGMPIEWEGNGMDEVGKYKGKTVVKINQKFWRPAEVDHLLGDSTKARTVLKWKPEVSLEEMIKMMVESDLRKVSA